MGAFLHRFTIVEADPRETGALTEELGYSLNVDVAPCSDGPLEIDASVRLLAEGCISREYLGNVSIARRAAHVARDGNDDLSLLLGLSPGDLSISFPDSRRAEEHAIRLNSPAILIRNDEASVLGSGRGGDCLLVTMPRSRIEPYLAGKDRLGEHVVAPGAALALLGAHASMLAADIGPMDDACAVAAADILRDLMVLALGASRDGREAARGGARAALLGRIEAEIRANLANPELSLAWLSRRFGISDRAIRDLFYAQDTSFTDYVLNARLDRAYALLTSPPGAGRTVTAVAYDAGFGDLSWFHQAFRRRFGMTPGEMKRSADGGTHAS